MSSQYSSRKQEQVISLNRDAKPEVPDPFILLIKSCFLKSRFFTARGPNPGLFYKRVD